MDFLRILIFLFGMAIVARTVFSAVQTFVLPRSARDKLTTLVFRSMLRLFNLPLKRTTSYEQRDRIMAYFAPIGLLALIPAYLILIFIGFAAMYWAVGNVGSVGQALKVSGSSIITLGYAAPSDLADGLLMFAEAATGLILVAVLIAYLPTIYSAFQRREQAVTSRSPQHGVARLGNMVCRHRRKPYFARGAGLLSIAAARAFVGHGGGRDPRCGGLDALNSRHTA
jgi:hypothetical protein